MVFGPDYEAVLIDQERAVQSTGTPGYRCRDSRLHYEHWMLLVKGGIEEYISCQGDAKRDFGGAFQLIVITGDKRAEIENRKKAVEAAKSPFPANIEDAQWAAVHEDKIQIQKVSRVSDADRTATIDRLKQALVDGVFDEAVFNARMAAALAATSQAQLDRLCSDLPARGIVKPDAPGAKYPYIVRQESPPKDPLVMPRTTVGLFLALWCLLLFPALIFPILAGTMVFGSMLAVGTLFLWTGFGIVITMRRL